MAEAFSRNIGLLTQAEQDKLANATVAIPGMGGVGGVHLITMTRTKECALTDSNGQVIIYQLDQVLS